MAQPAFQYTWCRDQFLSLQNGSISEIMGVTNETLDESGWIWKGAIGGLMDSFPRENIFAITYKGCVDVCQDKTELNTPQTAINIAATWVFPLAILFSLPYDSLHFKKWQRTIAATSHWLGSPQTALTSTIFNFDQIRKCHRQAKNLKAIAATDDAYYVLSCFNQFRLPTERGPGGRVEVGGEFVETLVYGLFRPLRIGEGNDDERNRDIEYTRQLLAALAAQLRMLRRRGVIPTLLSLGSFLLAFIFSVVLAFAEIGENVNVTPLTIGLLYSWLPLLVIGTIVDRNPVSSERTAELMSRWLYNVREVRKWREEPGREMEWWRHLTKLPPSLYVKEFIGQGRKMEYCGLPHATVHTIPHPSEIEDENGLEQYQKLAHEVKRRMSGPRPSLWWSSAIRALILVWIQILMAFAVAITSPTVGVGCWSGSFLVFGALTTVSWTISLFSKFPGRVLVGICHAANILALLWIIFITGLVLSGAMNNCYCNTTWMAYPLNGGYMIFEDYDFIRDHFNVVFPWAAACAVGFTVAATVFVLAVMWWMKCQHLWTTNERAQVPPPRGVCASMDWLQ